MYIDIGIVSIIGSVMVSASAIVNISRDNSIRILLSSTQQIFLGVNQLRAWHLRRFKERLEGLLAEDMRSISDVSPQWGGERTDWDSVSSD